MHEYTHTSYILASFRLFFWLFSVQSSASDMVDDEILLQRLKTLCGLKASAVSLFDHTLRMISEDYVGSILCSRWFCPKPSLIPSDIGSLFPINSRTSHLFADDVQACVPGFPSAPLVHLWSVGGVPLSAHMEFRVLILDSQCQSGLAPKYHCELILNSAATSTRPLWSSDFVV